ncbi:MAG: ZIP family metal transporter, partial [Anaerofustis stercorihominis]
MNLVIITAIGVGGATVVGALIGFLFKVISHKFSDVVLGFAAGIMLAASMIGLIIPSIESGGKHGIWISVLG